MAAIDALLVARATTASPAFTGTPTAPTPAPGDNSTKIATTGYVETSFAPLTSPAFSGAPTAPTPLTADNSTKIATTAYVQAQAYATLASPALTGTPSAPTPATADNTTKLATTAFVKAQGYLTANAVASVFGRTGAVVANSGDYTAAQVTNAADKSSGAIQAFTADVNAPNYLMGNAPQSANGTTSITPLIDTDGSIYVTHTGGGTLTVNNPGHFPAAGTASYFTLTVTSSGAGTTMAWGNAYKFGSGLVINNTLTAGQTQTWLFVMVGDESQAICLLSTGTF